MPNRDVIALGLSNVDDSARPAGSRIPTGIVRRMKFVARFSRGRQGARRQARVPSG